MALVSRAANSTPRPSGASANSDVRRGCTLILRTALVAGSTVHNAAPRNTPAGAATANSTRPVPGIHCGAPCDLDGRPGAVSAAGGVRPIDVDQPDRRVGAERTAGVEIGRRARLEGDAAAVRGPTSGARRSR